MKKTHTSNPAAFSSFPLGPLGWVSEDRVRVALRPVAKRVIIDVDSKSEDKEVLMFTVLLGDSGKVVKHVLEIGYDGIVLEARILLYLLLRAGKSMEEIRSVFENWI
ncbi:Asparaginase/glutaminase [mine drainage metagenome]|uniref:Asparaginase/glutaminase n=1 Tax=mine drainage metagenome TaxID=410659 RepID=T1BBA6_9ZZZZ